MAIVLLGLGQFYNFYPQNRTGALTGQDDIFLCRLQ